MADLLTHAPLCYHAEFGSSALKDVGINTGEPPKLGSAGTLLSWDGRRSDPLKTNHVPVCVTTFCNKGVCIGLNRKQPPKMGGAETRPSCGGGVADHSKTVKPPPYALPRQIWQFCVKGCVYTSCGMGVGDP